MKLFGKGETHSKSGDNSREQKAAHRAKQKVIAKARPSGDAARRLKEEDIKNWKGSR